MFNCIQGVSEAVVMFLLCLLFCYVACSNPVIAEPPECLEEQDSSPPIVIRVSSSKSASSSSSSSSSSSVVNTYECDENRCGSNATYKSCPAPCPGTCSNPAGIPNCYKMCLEKGCECHPGYVLSDDGRCILLKDCPDYLRCGGDRNATYKTCPNPCPRTCKYPGGTGPCSKMCLARGCECKDGYYKNIDGKCVKFQDCPRAKCSKTEYFAFCNARCPTDFCPVDDSRAIVACSPPFPCMSGCACKQNYLRLSTEDDRCIPAFRCPKVQCTRPNEVWERCPSPCVSERCGEVVPQNCDQQQYPCTRPRCVCKLGFCRNEQDICVPERH